MWCDFEKRWSKCSGNQDRGRNNDDNLCWVWRLSQALQSAFCSTFAIYVQLWLLFHLSFSLWQFTTPVFVVLRSFSLLLQKRKADYDNNKALMYWSLLVCQKVYLTVFMHSCPQLKKRGTLTVTMMQTLDYPGADKLWSLEVSLIIHSFQ